MMYKTLKSPETQRGPQIEKIQTGTHEKVLKIVGQTMLVVDTGARMVGRVLGGIAGTAWSTARDTYDTFNRNSRKAA